MMLLLELIGTVAFAVSGAFAGLEKKMDLFGVSIMGMTTAVGGGIIRDIIIGNTPPAAFIHPIYALTGLITSIVVFVLAPTLWEFSDSPVLMLMDAVGLGVFTVAGASVEAASGNAFLAVFLGTVTGIGGGMLRDIFAGRTPYVFVKDFYASAAILGALVYVMIRSRSLDAAAALGAAVVIAARVAAVKYSWQLPK